MAGSDIRRVDVSGYAVYVRGDEAMRYLEATNRKLAEMKMALHRILHMDPEEWGVHGIFKAQKIAREGLGDGK